MRRLALALITAVALAAAFPFPALSAPTRQYHWQKTSIEVWDATPFPALVDTVVANWNGYGVTLVVTKRTTCDKASLAPQGILLICADYYGDGGRASWTLPNVTGGKRVIKSAVVGINLSYALWLNPDPALDTTRQYLMCHEIGAAMGLNEAVWPYPDEYHHGCMNLSYQGPLPSPYDVDTLRAMYQ